MQSREAPRALRTASSRSRPGLRASSRFRIRQWAGVANGCVVHSLTVVVLWVAAKRAPNRAREGAAPYSA